ncbi:MAG: TrpR-like protein, YerC/YecD [Lachnospiraceae bacterium]|nr:TrpR-like protein, YerC/YecD [Lachnospiraceae bacterium]
MNVNLNEENLDLLFEAITTLETVEDCRKFFEDLCTVPELKAMSQRLTVAKLLSENIVYSKIVAQTGASTATISRVNRSLNYNSCDGYALVFERMKKKNGDSQEEQA